MEWPSGSGRRAPAYPEIQPGGGSQRGANIGGSTRSNVSSPRYAEPDSETNHDPTSTDENDAALKALLAKLEEEEPGNGSGGGAEDGTHGLDPIPEDGPVGDRELPSDDMPDDKPPEEDAPPEEPPIDYGSGNGKQLPFTRTVPPAQLPAKGPCAVRLEFNKVEGFDKDTCITIRRSSDDKKKPFKSGKIKHDEASSVVFVFAAGNEFHIEVLEKKTLGDKKIGSGTIPASQLQSLRPWQPEPLNVDMGGGIRLVGKATAIAPNRADFAQAPPALPEKEAVDMMGKMAKEIGSLKSSFHEKEMKVHAVIPVEAVQIQLDTWWEWRTNVTVSSSFSGKAAAGRAHTDYGNYKSAPDPWEHDFAAPPRYQKGEDSRSVPGTERVGDCTTCRSKCKMKHSTCSGRGQVSCHTCHGSGKVTKFVKIQKYSTQNRRMETIETSEKVPCEAKGCVSGKVRCDGCNGTGEVDCTTCNVVGQLLFKQVAQTEFLAPHDTNGFAFVGTPNTGEDALTNEMIAAAQGNVVFVDEAPNWQPPQNFSPELRNAVAKVLATARSTVDAKRGTIHCQKISISVVPVTQVVYWHPDDHQASFYIVGNDRTVRFQGYPKSTFGGGGPSAGGKDSLRAHPKYQVASVYDRVCKASAMHMKLQKLGGGQNERLQTREFFIVGDELVWFDDKKKFKGGIMLKLLQYDWDISFSTVELPAGSNMLGSLGHGVLSMASLGILYSVSPQKSVKGITIKVEKKKYILWCKDQSALEKFYEALVKARTATAVNI